MVAKINNGKSTKKTIKKTVKKVAKQVAKKAGKKVLDKITEPNIVEVTITKKIGKSIPEESHFYVKDGRRLKNVLELIDVFDDMSDDIFNHHVREDNNDFANWIHHALDEEKLAHDIKKAEDRMQMELKLLKHALKKIRT